MFYSGEQRVSNPAIITWLASTKAPKHNKGPETKFPEIFDELFARANSHDKVSMTNETGTPIKLAQTFVTKIKQLTKFSYLHEQMRFAIENLLVSNGLWALQRHRQPSQYTK